MMKICSCKSLTNQPNINNIPTEMLFLLFKYLSPKEVVACRRVCYRWMDVIDAYLKNDRVWERFCKFDYKTAYQQAMFKSPNITTWFEVYRSLSVWSQLPLAQDSMQELCNSNTFDDEIRNIVVQERGILMVHKRNGIFYHDIETLQVADRKAIAGQYKSILELEDIVIMLGWNSELHLIKKSNHNWSSDLSLDIGHDNEIWFQDVQTFLVGDRTLFYYTYTKNVYAFNLDSDNAAQCIVMHESFFKKDPHLLGAWGYKKGRLYFLSMSENMYMYSKGQVRLRFYLSSVTNLMDCLYQHNMLENLDWRHYYILLSDLGHQEHTGLLRSISTMKIHRDDIFFVGTQSIVTIQMYYKPFVNGRLNLNAFRPLKEYNLSDHVLIKPMQTVYLIVNSIKVIETKEGHKVLLCMQGKILVFTFKHDFDRPLSGALEYSAEQSDLLF